MKHTKGPWEISGGASLDIVGNDGHTWVGKIFSPKTSLGPKSVNETNANGALIYAAPELLETLIRIFNFFETGQDSKTFAVIGNSLELIKKAQGSDL